MKGWKTITAAAIFALCTFAQQLGDPIMLEYATFAKQLAIALGVIGIGHKLDKAS